MGLVILQVGIAATGNYGFFNLLSVVLCVPLLDDDRIRALVPRPGGATALPPAPEVARAGRVPFAAWGLAALPWCPLSIVHVQGRLLGYEIRSASGARVSPRSPSRSAP